MLVLTREIGDSIVIGDDIVITVLDINQGRAQLGFNAPKTTSIVREELLYRSNYQRDVSVKK